MPITPTQLADALHTALWCGTFGEAVKAHLQSRLDAWDAQEGTGERIADIMRDDPSYGRKALAEMPEADRRRHERAYAKYARLYGATFAAIEETLAGQDTDIGHSTHPAVNDTP